MRYFLAVLAAMLLAGCAISEKDNPLAPPMEGPDSAQVLVSSHPLGTTVEISEISGGKLKGVRIETTPVELTLDPNSYAFRFTKEGYAPAYNAILLGPRAYETVWVELDTIVTPPPPAPRPTASITITPETIVEGEAVTIEVTSENADLGFIAPIGIFTTGGEYADEPTRTTIYTFAVFGPGGVEVASDTVTVLPAPLPEVTLNLWASRTSITEGESVSIGWVATHADSVTLAPVAIGNVGLSGSWTDEPAETTTYTARAYRGGDVEVTRSITVTVNPRPIPELWLSAAATPETIQRGSLSYATWSSNGDYVTCDRFTGRLAPSGIRPVDPNATTTYVFITHRGGETRTASVTVTVVETPTAPPDSLVIDITIDEGVTTREGDREETLLDGIELPDNVGVRVYALVEYTGDQRGQRDEAAAIGGQSAVETHWAFNDDPTCPVFPDQAGFAGTDWFFIGTIEGFRSGSLVVRHAVEFDCYRANDHLRGPDSFQVYAVKLVVYLP